VQEVYDLLAGTLPRPPATLFSIRTALTKVMMQYARLDRVSIDAEALSSGSVPRRDGMPGALRGELPALLPGPLFVVEEPPKPKSTPASGTDSPALHLLFANVVLSKWQDVREELMTEVDKYVQRQLCPILNCIKLYDGMYVLQDAADLLSQALRFSMMCMLCKTRACKQHQDAFGLPHARLSLQSQSRRLEHDPPNAGYSRHRRS
jgi:hypothetical protein